MSLDATLWAWRQQGLSAPQKLVLLSLADRANERHRCYPSIARLSRDCCMAERTVRRAVEWLESEGIIEAKRSAGTVTLYQLIGVVDRHDDGTPNPGQRVTPVRESPRSESPHTPVRESTHPGQRVHTPRSESPPNLSITSQEPLIESGSAPKAGAPTANSEQGGGRKKRGSRLPDDWSLPDEWAAWAKERLPDIDVSDQADQFRDYWIALPGQRAVKTDWQATWRNWIRRTGNGNGSNQRGGNRRQSAAQAAQQHRDNDRDWAARKQREREQQGRGGSVAH